MNTVVCDSCHKSVDAADCENFMLYENSESDDYREVNVCEHCFYTSDNSFNPNDNYYWCEECARWISDPFKLDKYLCDRCVREKQDIEFKKLFGYEPKNNNDVTD